MVQGLENHMKKCSVTGLSCAQASVKLIDHLPPPFFDTISKERQEPNAGSNRSDPSESSREILKGFTEAFSHPQVQENKPECGGLHQVPDDPGRCRMVAEVGRGARILQIWCELSFGFTFPPGDERSPETVTTRRAGSPDRGVREICHRPEGLRTDEERVELCVNLAPRRARSRIWSPRLV